MFKIAICDDNLLTLESINCLFQYYADSTGEDIEVNTFLSPEELLDEELAFDLYLINTHFQGRMAGIEMCKKIEEINPYSYIVLMSADSSSIDEAATLPICGYLLKPVNPDILFEMLDTLIKKKA